MGDVEVVQGVDMAIPLMSVGELAEISTDARFAYGTQGLTNEKDNTKSIPANAKVSITQMIHYKSHMSIDLISIFLFSSFIR